MGLYEWAAVWRACRWPSSSFKKLRPRISGLAAGRMPVSRLFMTYAGSACGQPAPRARPSTGRLSFPASGRCSGPTKSPNECRPTRSGPLERAGVLVGGIPGPSVVTPLTSTSRVSTSGEGADQSRPAPRGSAPPVRDAGPLVGSSTASCVTVPPVPPDPAT